YGKSFIEFPDWVVRGEPDPNAPAPTPDPALHKPRITLLSQAIEGWDKRSSYIRLQRLLEALRALRLVNADGNPPAGTYSLPRQEFAQLPINIQRQLVHDAYVRWETRPAKKTGTRSRVEWVVRKEAPRMVAILFEYVTDTMWSEMVAEA